MRDEAGAPVCRISSRPARAANIVCCAILALAGALAAGLPLRPRLVAPVAVIALYVPLAGAGPSIQRAGIMGAAAPVAALCRRPADRWYALLLAAAGALALDPLAIGEPGWQMSFAAVVGLAPRGWRLRAWARLSGRRAALAEAVAVTVAATLGTAP